MLCKMPEKEAIMSLIRGSHPQFDYIFASTFLGLIAAILLVSSVTAQAFDRIRSEDGFRALVVGKVITGDRGWAKFLPNGSMDGSFNGLKLRGAWIWHDRYLCRNVKLGSQPETGTNCQVVRISGNRLRLTRDRGQGEVVNYTIE